ncbi:TonB-dependent receptor [Ferruginibacter sp. HRS2-29]|uniref:TonB-dependent receptor n=1 Tax=Ferruginibacter sp. HRS2-29 TaxID=2487334 RepID=UPI0020CE56FC|nr:TonB-dependent receptor [Ferruginibacter sp. HRS2-29]MCP9750879.1 TonB-dependent receptor [Ferruginibacter sp. HRS2-29]
MKRITSYLVAFVLANILAVSAYAQNVTISGNVQNSATSEKSAAVSVTIKGSETGTYTDDRGNFSITTKSLPVTLIFSSIGYEQQEVSVTSAAIPISVKFVPSNSLGQEVVVSASRVPQKILESPVSIERVSAAAIRNAPAANFYDVISTLKGVDVTTSSLTFKAPTTRGFGGSGNTRFNQLVDGMDNQAPGLNFSVGSIIGLNELDIDNLELLSGASSALYGPGGMNGTLLMTSKNPFKYQGLSYVVKTGIMHTDRKERAASPYYNLALRWGKKISEKFAFKLTTELVQAKDWIGTDYRNYDRSGGVLKPGDRVNDPAYDGVNVYGDETNADIRQVLNGAAAAAPFLAPFIATLTTKPIVVSRTGYTEQELINPNTVNFKLGGSFHYKLSPGTEAILAGYWGTGNTIYTGASRYSIKDFKMGQYKFELLNKDWMFRAYTTQENAGGTYNLAATTQNFNEAWKPSAGSTGWFAQYGQAFLGAKLGGASDFDAHQLARGVADQGRPKVGTPQFRALYDNVAKIPVPKGGALLDRTDLYSVEGNYNFSRFTKAFADILVGANYRNYVLNSQGTLFADTAGTIGIREVGAFIQASRDLGIVKLTASGRYDKNENFEGRFTPRVTAVVKVAENNNIRLSYQTAYRFPSTQQQWINLDLLSYKLIGGNDAFNTIYNFGGNPLYDRDSLRAGKVVAAPFVKLKPESLSSFEVGYKGLLMDSKLLVDVYGYFGRFTDFLARKNVVQSKTGSPISLADTANGQIYSVPINADGKLKTYGFGIGFDYRLPRNFTLSVNAASDNLDDVPTNIIANFNSPKYKVNASISNSGFGKEKRLGFTVAYRWQDEFYYQGDLANGTVPSVQTLDAQFSYKLPTTKSVLKVGANNLLNQYYYNAIGNSRVGGLYYVSFGYNIY